MDGFVSDIMEIAPVAEKWRQVSGGTRWRSTVTDFVAIEGALAEAAATKGKPTWHRGHTIKGKGVSFMGNNPKFHGVAPDGKMNELA